MAKATYKNPWHKRDKPEYGPVMYETDETPVEYKGYLIYERVIGLVWDIVKDGVCVMQMAGPRGARDFIDKETK